MKGKNLKSPRKKYQCFISSTYDDLREERTEAIHAILDAGHIPAGMEYFEAGRPQKETIEKWMDESDLIIFIIGGRYGTINTETGNSYTEDEYDYTINKGKKHFSIILSDLYLSEKEVSYIKNNSGISLYESKNKKKYKKFLDKVRKDECVEVDSKEGIKFAIIKNISIWIQEGKLAGGWIECNADSAIDINELSQEDKKQELLSLIKEHLAYISIGSGEQKIAEQYYHMFEQYHQSLKRYMTSVAYSIEIRLFDDFIEVHNTSNQTYRLAPNIKSNFLYNPWMYEGMECETFEITNLKYNNKDVEEKYIARGEACYTENPFYVKDVVRVAFPFDENKDEHKVQYSVKYRTEYDRYFHEYIFKEFCQHMSLVVSLQDYRLHKNNKEYMLKWEMFTPYDAYDYLL